MHPETGSWSPEELRSEIALYKEILKTADENWSAVISDMSEGGEPSEEHLKQLAQAESNASMRINELRDMLAGKTAEMFNTWLELGVQQQNIVQKLENAEGQEAKDLVEALKKVIDQRHDLGEGLRKEMETSMGEAA